MDWNLVPLCIQILAGYSEMTTPTPSSVMGTLRTLERSPGP